MSKHFRTGRWIVSLSVRRNRFVGIGLEVDGGAGGMGLVIWLPLIDLTIEMWNRKRLERAAEELTAMANLTKPKVDWSQYAPSGRR